MTSQTTTMKALVEAVQDVASSDDEAVAVLKHLLSTRRIMTERARGAVQVSKSFF